MNIRRLECSDVRKYRQELIRYVYENVRIHILESSYKIEDAKNKVDEMCEYIEQDKAIVVAAFVDSELKGLLWAYRYPFRDDKNRLYISLFHVDMEYRGRQIGTALFKEIEKISKEERFDGLFLHADAINNGACHFYKKMGFEEERIQFVRRL